MTHEELFWPVCQTPQHYKIASGLGFSSRELVAFDNALINAGISDYNLIKISSILPAGAQEEPEIGATKGSIIPTAFRTVSTNRCNVIVQTGVAVGIPKDRTKVGVIMETDKTINFTDFFPAGDLPVFCINQLKTFEGELENMVIEAMSNRSLEIAEVKLSTAGCCIASSQKFFELLGCNHSIRSELPINFFPYENNRHCCLISAVCLW